MFRLGLAEDGLDDNLLRFLVDHEFPLFLESFLALKLTVTEKQVPQLHLFTVIVVRGNLIKPQSNLLVVCFHFLGLGHVLLSCCVELFLHLVLGCAPFRVPLELGASALVAIIVSLFAVVITVSILRFVFVPATPLLLAAALATRL